MCQGTPVSCFSQWCASPPLPSLCPPVKLLQPGDELGLLALEHLDVTIACSQNRWTPRGYACTHPFGYTLSCDFLRSPKTQMALSALHLLQGLDPSHWRRQNEFRG